MATDSPDSRGDEREPFDRDEHWRELMERRAERDARLEKQIEEGSFAEATESVDRGGEPLGILEKMRAGMASISNPVVEREQEEVAERRAAARKAQLTLAGMVALAVVVLIGIMTLRPEPYTVTATFENASQLVPQGEVTVGGANVGSIGSVELGDNGEALVELSITDEGFEPLPRGTVAVVRSISLSGIANRQVSLQLPPEGTSTEEIPDGGTMDASETVSEVDLDEIFNTLDTETVADLKKVIRGFEISYEGVGTQANEGFRYLNPFLYSSRRLFAELSRDERALEQLLVDGDRLSGALAERRDEIPELVSNLNQMMGAIGREKTALASSIRQLPQFMRLFNTTGVNLRFALDDLDPLVDASKPVAEKLQPFFADFRTAARNLVPTVRDLDKIILDPGTDNDLVDLTRIQPGLAEIAVGPVTRNGEEREGAFPEAAEALTDGLDELAFFRAYTPELVGWFNDFGRSGIDDANGGIGRISVNFNTFSVSPLGLAQPFLPALDPLQILDGLDTQNTRRCPGANERPQPDGSNPFTDGGTINCDPTMVPPGP